MFNNDFLFHAPICIGVGIVAYFLFLKNSQGRAIGLYNAPRLIPLTVRHTGHSAQHYVCHLIPLVAALLQCTKNAIHIGHFGTIGKVSRKYF